MIPGNALRRQGAVEGLVEGVVLPWPRDADVLQQLGGDHRYRRRGECINYYEKAHVYSHIRSTHIQKEKLRTYIYL